MLPPMESTYQGYISSTHDALLVFECVRRGVMPKVKRRLREEERKLIRSGQVFVFDEKESGIKRWTDGLVWSPSRILWNFLVYRQVDKKFSGRPGTAQRSLENSPSTLDVGLPGNDSTSHSTLTSEYDPYALGVTGSADSSLYNTIKAAPSLSVPTGTTANQDPSRNRSISSASDSYSNWITNDVSLGEEVRPGSLPSQKANDEERSLVGSLKSSYPFAKGGLCKKTISIQVDGTTQHLISYYTVDDVRSGRLRTPSSLPEIASLTISPILLTKTSFRFPPTIHLGPDGVPRFRGEDGYKVETGSAMAESSGEGNSSGSESRYTFYRSNPTMRHPQMQNGMLPMGSSGMESRMSSSAMMNMRLAPMSHQVGGSGVYRPTQRSPDGTSLKARNSFEPYPKRTSLKSMSDESGLATSPGSTHSAPGGFANRRFEGLPDSSHHVNNVTFYPHSFGQTSSEELGAYNQGQNGLNVIASGLAVAAEDGLNPYKEEEDSRQRLMDELLADQITTQETDVPWQTPNLQQEQLRQRVIGDFANEEARWAPYLGVKSVAPQSYHGPIHYTPSGEQWSNTSTIPHHQQAHFGFGQQQHRYGHQQTSSRAMNHQEESARRQHYHTQQMESPYPPTFTINAPTDSVRAALSHSSLHNRPTQPSYYATYKPHATPLRPIAVNKARDEGLNLS